MEMLTGDNVLLFVTRAILSYKYNS